jgi:hypothetical protein
MALQDTMLAMATHADLRPPACRVPPKPVVTFGTVQRSMPVVAPSHATALPICHQRVDAKG